MLETYALMTLCTFAVPKNNYTLVLTSSKRQLEASKNKLPSNHDMLLQIRELHIQQERLHANLVQSTVTIRVSISTTDDQYLISSGFP